MAAKTEGVSVVDLAGKVEVPVAALIDAAATFYAYGNLIAAVADGSDYGVAEELWKPAGALLEAAGLARRTADGDDYSLSEGVLRRAASTRSRRRCSSPYPKAQPKPQRSNSRWRKSQLRRKWLS